MEFKVGHIVVCQNSSGYDDMLTEGFEYTVIEVKHYSDINKTYLRLEGVDLPFDACRFTLSPSEG